MDSPHTTVQVRRRDGRDLPKHRRGLPHECSISLDRNVYCTTIQPPGKPQRVATPSDSRNSQRRGCRSHRAEVHWGHLAKGRCIARLAQPEEGPARPIRSTESYLRSPAANLLRSLEQAAGKRLVPIRHRGDVIGKGLEGAVGLPSKGLNAYPQVAFEQDRIGDVPTV